MCCKNDEYIFLETSPDVTVHTVSGSPVQSSIQTHSTRLMHLPLVHILTQAATLHKAQTLLFL